MSEEMSEEMSGEMSGENVKPDIKKRAAIQIDMCNGSILGKMMLFVLPLIASGLLQLLFNAADIVVVGQWVGDDAMAAVGSNTSLINLVTNIFMGLSVGANVLTSRYYGAKHYDELEKTIHTSICISLISGLLLIGVGMVGARQMLVWMHSPKEVIDLATLYLKIYFLGMPAMMVYNFGSAILRSVGDTFRPLIFLTVSGVVNVLLNLFFVIFCHLSVAGVGLATILSQYLSAGLVVWCMVREEGPIHLNLRRIRICPAILGKILWVGIPAGLQGVVFSLSNVVIQSSVNDFGHIVVAGNSAAQNLEGFVYVSMNAFHQATISFTGQNMGAGKFDRIKKIVIYGEASVFVVGEGLGLLVLLLGPVLLRIYSSNPEVIQAGMTRLLYICAVYALCGMMDVMVGGIRGMGFSIVPTIVSLVGACALRLIWLATIFQMPQYHSIETVYISYPISWLLTLLAHIFCFLIMYRIRKKRYTAIKGK